MNYENIKMVPLPFKWRLSAQKLLFVTAFKSELSNFDPAVIELYKKLWSFNSAERTFLQYAEDKKHNRNIGVMCHKSRLTFCHRAVQRALKLGMISKQNCQGCNRTDSVAHHEDYREPITVIWLCSSCHQNRHAVINKEIKEGSYTQASIASN